MPYDELIRAEFYNDFGRHNDIVHTAGAVLTLEQSCLSYLSLNRGEDAGEFTTSDLAVFRILQPHLSRAVEISRTLQFASR